MSYLPRIIQSDMTINVPSDFGTVADALRSIEGYVIAGNATITINVEAGGYTCSETPEIWHHQCANRIKIIGQVDTTTATSVYSTSGGAGAHSITYNVSDVSSATTDYRVIIRDADGTGAYRWHQGAWEITAVDSGNSRITVINVSANPSVPTNTITSANIDIMKSIIVGYVVINASFLLIEGLAFHTSASSVESYVCNIGMPISSVPYTEIHNENISAFLKTCSFSGNSNGLSINEARAALFRCAASTRFSAQTGVQIYNSFAYLNYCYAAGNRYGLTKKTGYVTILSSSFTGNVTGIADNYADGYNTTYIEGSTISFNAGTAYFTSNSSTSMSGVDIQGNGTYAVYAYSNADVTLLGMTIKNNYGTTADVYAIGSANIYIEVTDGTYTHPKSSAATQYDTSPPHETVGNYNSYIEAY